MSYTIRLIFFHEINSSNISYDRVFTGKPHAHAHAPQRKTSESNWKQTQKAHFASKLFLFSFYLFRVESFFQKHNQTKKNISTKWNEFKISGYYAKHTVVCSRWNVSVCV